MKHIVVAAVAIVALFACGVSVGRYTAKPVVQTKEVIRWAEKTVSVVQASAASETKQQVRVVTKWLRPDGTTARLQLRESGTVSHRATSLTSSTAMISSGQAVRASESRTVDRPRFSAGAMLGLDLRAGAARQWGVFAAWRVAGPVTVGAWALPGLRVGGASVGVAF